MTTVTFTCEHCRLLMAVEIENLGKAVQCPHCQRVVQAPLGEIEASPATSRSSETPLQSPALGSENVWVDPAPPPPLDYAPPLPPALELDAPIRLDAELPLSVLPVEALASLPSVTSVKDASPLPPDRPVPLEPVEPEFPAFAKDASATTALSENEAATDSVLPDTQASLPVRRRDKGGMLVPMILMVLIPWAIIGPALAFYVGMRWFPAGGDSGHPLERLPDPNPKDGGPERIKHDQELPKKQKTALKQPLEIGDVRVTPLDVELTPHGDLLLTLRVRNLSATTKFNPLPESFLRDTWFKKDDRKLKFAPYTFLEFGGERIYGGAIAYRKGPEGAEENADSGVILPEEEVTILLRTRPEDRKKVKEIADFRGPMTWRVQVRRGLVESPQKEVSLTAVIGVVFDAQIVQRQQDGRAD
jgi:hypothetical protein